MPATSFLDRHHFLLRRLHSLSGVMPIGVFLIFHLLTNSSAAWGGVNNKPFSTFDERGIATFQKEVNFIHDLPFLLLMEIFALWLPIAFHSILGVYYAMSGKGNVGRYQYQSNWRYTLQRATGYIGVLFIFYHVATLRWGWTFLVPGGTKWDHQFASSTLAAALQGSTEGLTAAGAIVSLFYFLGVTAMVFHFANGLWTAAITWGITISAAAQRRWGYACAGLGAGLMLLGWSATIRFVTLDYQTARGVELKMLEGKAPVGQRGPTPQPGRWPAAPQAAGAASGEDAPPVSSAR